MLTSTRLRARKGDSRQATTDVVRPYDHSARYIPESVAAALDATAASID
ncbi:hypothetical protein REJC140_03424 [Pseudorhizobium endolithicum]|uniref:Uncharacterized protein n=1 Tax=Pseudorhizobium endolithicum TaxID=1191678 RepID=A0ABN7JKE4_9HYPH|nr:hypothetical protein [Pseudorhizobium endolithicum]CAD7035561.1 hypothetical protein REJC140_03424 [Pseudorhizobium endolithicum]